ncbi:hypothetical protein GH714_004952 [Hevea brasiliensis]|uniref:Bulb-type lectin domain-containing protein n=1 Tax=Hevea brasiliensis TaxID=3981 RepID=A0A6A6MBF8_HEVBR|nr:hypothetical protein GH714_004952 [Hevea brasiliensis]
MDTVFFMIVLSLIILPIFSYSATNSALRGGSYLSAENPEDFLTSAGGDFSAGFYPVGDNAYCFAIWLSKPSCGKNCTVVWMANRDFPVNGKRSELLLLKTGNLIFTNAGRTTAWSTDTTSQSPADLHLHDTGNLVLKNVEDDVIWQSFDSPTDTLLPLQPLTNIRSLSHQEATLTFLVVSTSYFSMIKIFLVFSMRVLRFQVLIGQSRGIKTGKEERRLTLDSDGSARLYSREMGSATWVVSWQAKTQLCEIHGICGPNSTCNYNPLSGSKCSCLPGYKMKKTDDWSYGCEQKFNLLCSNHTEIDFIQLKHVEFYGYDGNFYRNVSLEECKKFCLESCNCKGFQYRYMLENDIPHCFPKTLLSNGQYTPSFIGDFFVKVPKTRLFSSNEVASGFGFDICSSEHAMPMALHREYARRPENGTLKFMLLFAYGFGGVEIIGILLVWCLLNKSQKDSNEATENYHPATTGFKRFTYSELKKAIRNFSQEIGRAAGGIVYQGMLEICSKHKRLPHRTFMR